MGFTPQENGLLKFQPVQEKVLAVDGDIIAYRTAAVCEDHFEGACQAILQSTLDSITSITGIKKMRIYLSGKSNFRYDVAVTKPYKGNRVSMVRPQFLPACREFLMEYCNAIVVDGFEADDAIATDMTVNGAYHCGIDKDILQIEGKHYNYVKDEWAEVSAEQAIITLHRQILKGDASDNIPGLPRIGDKKAADAIQDASTALEDTMAMYEEVVGLKMPGVNWLEYLSEQSRLVTMVKDMDLDYTNNHFVDAECTGFAPQENGFVSLDQPKAAPKKDISL